VRPTLQRYALIVSVVATSGSSGNWTFKVESHAAARVALVGDSTVAEHNPLVTRTRGWGQFLQLYVDRRHVVVRNFAIAGSSSKTFWESGQWSLVRAFRPTVVFLQFGHNDSHVGNPKEAAPPWTDYMANLQRFVEESRALGAEPVIVTPVHRVVWATDSELTTELVEYAEAARLVGVTNLVPIVDLYARSGELFLSIGRNRVDGLLANTSVDRSHFNEAGARRLAQLVAEDTKVVMPSLAGFIRGPG
jgi:DNA sulfur modification protein DndE